MQFLAEQHLVAAKLVRKNGAARTGAERELFIRKSNSFVVCSRLMATDRGAICLDNFDWWSLTLIGTSSMNKFDGLCRRVSTAHPSFPISGSSGDPTGCHSVHMPSKDCCRKRYGSSCLVTAVAPQRNVGSIPRKKWPSPR
jgi:hypothetical protein